MTTENDVGQAALNYTRSVNRWAYISARCRRENRRIPDAMYFFRYHLPTNGLKFAQDRHQDLGHQKVWLDRRAACANRAMDLAEKELENG